MDSSKIIYETHEKVAEFLYPCVIEYCLLAMTIFYVLWSNFKSRYTQPNHSDNYSMKPIESRRKSFSQTKKISEFGQGQNRFIMDCGKATTG